MRRLRAERGLLLLATLGRAHAFTAAAQSHIASSGQQLSGHVTGQFRPAAYLLRARPFSALQRGAPAAHTSARAAMSAGTAGDGGWSDSGSLLNVPPGVWLIEHGRADDPTAGGRRIECYCGECSVVATGDPVGGLCLFFPVRCRGVFVGLGCL